VQDISILVIDDRDVFHDFDSEQPKVKGLPKEVPPHRFTLKFLGAVQGSTADGTKARPIFDSYLGCIAGFVGGNILLLDLGLDEVSLTAEERHDAETLFSDVFLRLDGSGEEKKGVPAGTYVLKKALDNNQWYGEICIVSSQVDANLRALIENSLINEAHGNRVGPATRVGNVYVRFFAEGMIVAGRESPSEVSDSASSKIAEAITYFLKDFDDVSWFLSPPALIGSVDNNASKWFPSGAHKSGKDFDNHLEAVVARFGRWNTQVAATALVSDDFFPPFEIKWNDLTKNPKRIRVACLRDFFGEEMESSVPDEKLITLPTIPAFPFLVALQRLFNELRSAKQQPAILRSFPVNQDDILCLGLNITGAWSLAERLWSTKRTGDTWKIFLDALDARLIDLSDGGAPRSLRNVLSGFPNIATPWITEDFVGVSWKTKITDVPTE
jgi:hypothetical protein